MGAVWEGKALRQGSEEATCDKCPGLSSAGAPASDRCRQGGLYLADGAATGRGMLWAGEQQLSQAKEGLFLAAVVWVFSTLALPASRRCPTPAG